VNQFNRGAIVPGFAECRRTPTDREAQARELAQALAGCTIKPTVVPGFTQVEPRPVRSSRVDPETRLVRKHYGIPAGIARDLEREQKEAAQIRAMVESLEVQNG
jgi:hypothetical protein